MRMDVEVSNGKLRINGTDHNVPNIDLNEVVGQGANGIVLLGQHHYMKRRVAVKIWMRLWQRDTRDKFEQGIREVNKASEIESDNIARVYDAGKLGEFFYAVFEYVEGITSKRWLSEHKPNLLSRLRFASSITNDVFSFHYKGVIHGDLHTDNILVMKPYVTSLTNGIFTPDYKIVDFGTSHFSPKGFSEKRHWNIFNKTIIKLLQPLNIQTLWGNKYPHGEAIMYVHQWYYSFFEEIPNMIRSFGMNLIADPNDASKWTKNPGDEAPQYSDDSIRAKLQRMRATGTLVLKPEAIGIIHID
jgi:serine/threonine protein kinase